MSEPRIGEQWKAELPCEAKITQGTLPQKHTLPEGTNKYPFFYGFTQLPADRSVINKWQAEPRYNPAYLLAE
jgi:hypothetical protein